MSIEKEKVVKFRSPHEVTGPPGVEGWERMYSPAYSFTPREVDPDKAKWEEEQLWIMDSIHQPPVPWPMALELYDTNWWSRYSQTLTNVFCFPAAAGLDHRMLYGFVYVTPTGFTDPKQIAEREKLFPGRINHYYAHWDEALENLRKHQRATSRAIEEIRFEELPDIVPESDVTEFKGTWAYTQMEKNWRRVVDLWEEAWDVHFEMFGLAHGSHLVFTDFCKKAFPKITDAVIVKMVAGVGADIYRPDEEVQTLARLALESEVADAILQPGSFDEVEARLRESMAGRKWLAELEARKDPWFYFSTGWAGMTPYDKTWLEDLNLPLALLRRYIQKLKSGETIGANRDAIASEADRIASMYRELLKEEEKPVFDQLRLLDRKCSPHAEGHQMWFECLHNYPMRKRLEELGIIFANHHLMDEPVDIWYLRFCEVEELIKDYIRCKTCYPPGMKPQSAWYWPKEIRWRKKVCKILSEWQPPEALGTAPAEITDPALVGNYGVTPERIRIWHEAAEIKPEEVTELKGFLASPGVAEGTARVLLDINKIGEVKPGEILVCRATSPSWGPVFAQIGAVITDIGGMMNHAAIVAREYGIPAVTGTGTATKIIKTGDVIRVDGDNGIVTIVKRGG